MILSKNEILERKELEIVEEPSINKEDIEACKDIISLNDISCKLHAQYISGLVVCRLSVNANLTLKSTRTLKPVEYSVSDENEYTLTFEKLDYDLEDEDIIEVEGNEYDFYQDIVSMVITNIPLKIIGKDDPEHLEGNNWEVISEDEYNKRKTESKDIDPRLAAFADIDIDE